MTDNNDVVEGTETETSVMPGAEAHVQEDFAEADFGDDVFLDSTEETTPATAETVSKDEQSTEEATEAETEAETKAEAEAETEAETETAAVEAPASSERKNMVPKSRLDEVLRKVKDQQEKLNRFAEANKNQAPADATPETQTEFDFDGKEDEYQDAVLDGRKEDAKALRASIRAQERAELLAEMNKVANDKVDTSSASNRVADALAEAATIIEGTYPALNQGAPEFNEEYLDEVVELRDAFIVKGEQPVTALEKAVRYVVNTNGIAPVADLAPASRSDEVSNRRRRSIDAKLKAESQQPARLPGDGEASREAPEIKLSDLTDEEFAALPPATLARLQGDFG